MFKIFKKDDLKMGLLWGFIAPFFGCYGYYLWKVKSAGSFISFIKFLGYEKHLIKDMATFSLLANAIVFTIYINNGKDKTARGIFIITCIYVIATLVLRWVY